MNSTLKNLLLFSALLLTLPTAALAGGGQGYSKGTSCGPYLDTYRVTDLNNAVGKGIRCLKLTNSSSTKSRNYPAFAWYGEGIWGTDRTYRHVGQAFNTKNKSELIGYASDIPGNGATADGNFSGNLKIKIVDRDTIEVTGAWNEKWSRVAIMDHTWLPNPESCGNYMTSYQVSSVEDALAKQPGLHGTGLRCELNIGRSSTTWIGFGDWSGATYFHLGTRNSRGEIGSSDFCRNREVCYMKAFGELKRTYSPVLDGIMMQGWADLWKKN